MATVDFNTRQLISSIANTVLSTYSISTPIDDIEKVVSTIGGTVAHDDNLNELSDGYILKTDSPSFTIYVSPSITTERKNFTIAHELGHLFLHMGYTTDSEKWEKADNVKYKRSGTSDEEYEANEFAAAFLMPKEQYYKVLLENSNNQIVYTNKIAEYFHVSVNAAATRGKWLGYIRW